MALRISQLAEILRLSTEDLVKQLSDAGIEIDGSVEDAEVTADQKKQLLAHLSKRRGAPAEMKGTAPPKRLTIQRTTKSNLRVDGRLVTVRAKKTREFTQRDDTASTDAGLVSQEALEKEQKEAVLAIEEEKQKAKAEERRESRKEKERAEEEAKALAEKERAEKEKAALEAAPSSEAKSGAESEKTSEASKAAKPAADASEKTFASADKKSSKSAPKVSDGEAEKRRAAKRRMADKRGVGSGRLTRQDLLKVAATGGEGVNRRGARRRGGKAGQQQAFELPSAPMVHEVEIGESNLVSELAKKMSVKAVELVKILMNMGTMVTINQSIDADTATLLIEEMGHKPKVVSENILEENLLAQFSEQDAEKLPRPPVVTIMGHVDHGKTSLLDYIRRTRVTSGEAGGITQHIGAYHVEMPKGVVTFLDTPGHEAFTAMRARGTKCTDIVILVVAADDGVKPQTLEAIQHARAAEVPIIVAVNKVDKEEADPDRVKTELSSHEVICEDWGGDVMFANVSAKTGAGIDALLEAILLQSEMLELRAPVDTPAQGSIVESRLDRGRGPVATVLVQAGTLRQGDIILAGSEYGRVRALLNESGQRIDEAGPSIPVEVLGLSGVPNAGDDVFVLDEERKARELALLRASRSQQTRFAQQAASSFDALVEQLGEGKAENLNVIVKAGVQGSVEALREALAKLSTSEVKVNVVASGVGGISESDVNLALASQAMIIGFNVRADVSAKRLAEREKAPIHYHNIIYDVIEELKQLLSGMLSPDVKEKISGLAEVRDVFRSSKLGAIAGCMVIDGQIKRHLKIRVLRSNVVIFEGELESLRRFKDDIAEVRQGMECGIGVKNYNDIKVGDQIEVYETIQVARTLEV